ncbi:MAG: response regulator [Bdellovibrionales bacterium]|nr:response regulator [Bdellovibrionales bacterium]
MSKPKAGHLVPRLRPTVLLLEDEQELQSLIRESLEASGLRVLTSDSIADVQFKLHNQAFDAIVMDMRVKGGDSASVVEALIRAREDATGKKTTQKRDAFTANAFAPLVMMSGYFDPSSVKRIATATPHVFVKPFSMGAVVDRVRELLDPESSAKKADEKNAA